jgi:KaiC/GvpD/RAD55 family RecA-like ATPase
MSRDDKITRMESFMQVLLLHLIKQQVEHRTTKSWDISILNACDGILRFNKRRKAGGWYLTDHELYEALEETYDTALRQASLEAFEGTYTPEQLASRHDRTRVLEEARVKIRQGRPE